MRRAILITTSVIFLAGGIGAGAASAAGAAASGANLAITQVAVPSAKGVELQIAVTNRGPEAATSVVMHEILHADGITAVTMRSRPPATCKPIVVAGADAARKCGLGSLAAGAQWLLVARVAGGPAGTAISATGTPPTGDSVAIHCTLASLSVGDQWRVRVVASGPNGRRFTATAQTETSGSYDPDPANDAAALDDTFAPTQPIASPGSEWLVINGTHSAAQGFLRIKHETTTTEEIDGVAIPNHDSSALVPQGRFDFEVVAPASGGDSYAITSFTGGSFVKFKNDGATIEIKIAFLVRDTTQSCAIGATAESAACTLPAAGFRLGITAAFPHDMTQGLTVTPVDIVGQRVGGYRGTMDVSATDPDATLPGAYTFTAADGGTHAFTVAFANPGFQVLTATDSAFGTRTGAGLLMCSPRGGRTGRPTSS